MRTLVRWFTLLVCVAIVVAMGWYGARALLGEPEPDGSDDPSSSVVERSCEPATRKEAQRANRAFFKAHARDAWFTGVGVTTTDRVDDVAGEGWVLLVTTVTGDVPDLPTCFDDVPVSYLGTGRFRLE